MRISGADHVQLTARFAGVDANLTNALLVVNDFIAPALANVLDALRSVLASVPLSAVVVDCN